MKLEFILNIILQFFALGVAIWWIRRYNKIVRDLNNEGKNNKDLENQEKSQ